MLVRAMMVLGLALAWSGPAVAESEADISDVLEAYSQALSNEDVAEAERWVLVEGTQFSIFEGSGSDIGWAEYRDHHLAPEFAAEHFAIQVYDWSGYTIQADDALAFATFNIRMEYAVHGEARERDAHGTAILLRTDAGWRIKHLHTS
jgi:hypothetical protein